VGDMAALQALELPALAASHRLLAKKGEPQQRCECASLLASPTRARAKQRGACLAQWAAPSLLRPSAQWPTHVPWPCPLQVFRSVRAGAAHCPGRGVPCE